MTMINCTQEVKKTFTPLITLAIFSFFKTDIYLQEI